MEGPSGSVVNDIHEAPEANKVKVRGQDYPVSNQWQILIPEVMLNPQLVCEWDQLFRMYTNLSS